MEKIATSNLKLGIICGGQLGKMLIQEASKWDIITYTLDADENCPAAGISSVFVKGSNFDYDAVYNFGKLVDILTFEIEHVNVEALKKLKSEGLNIVPDPHVLELIQDKGLQKCFYRDNGIPTASFDLFGCKKDIFNAINENRVKFPFVQKLRKGGFDGRGVAVINNLGEVDKLLEGPSLIEEKVVIEKEIAIIAARNQKGETKCFPAVEMVFNEHANLVERLVCPSSLTPELNSEAEALASKLIESLDMAGLLAVEFFVDVNGQLIVNESAPRPHNSGHHTIESVTTSQYEQHIRAILNLPLGSTSLISPSVLINLLGEPFFDGPVFYEGFSECLAIDGVKIHLYGKKIARPYRKMGHVTVISQSLESANKKADKVMSLLKVKSWKN